MSVRLSVNGTEVTVAPGATLLAACRAAGAAVPTLCTDDRLAYGSAGSAWSPWRAGAVRSRPA